MRALAFAGLLLLAAPVWLASQRGAPAPAAANQKKACEALATCISSASNGKPPINGRGGMPPDYDFNHTADVNESGRGASRKYIYEHQIQNKNPGAVLWTEWRDGVISFQYIPPCGCAPGYYESTIEPKEKPDSEIRYGQGKQFPHIASAYVRLNQAQPSAPQPPSLMSRLFARLEKFLLDLNFVTEALPDNRFRYTIQNKSPGDGTVLFSIPALTARWAQFQPLGPALQGSAWRTPGQPVTVESLFIAPAAEPAAWTVAAPPGTLLREESAELFVYLNDRGTLLASGVVSVYVPVRPG